MKPWASATPSLGEPVLRFFNPAGLYLGIVLVLAILGVGLLGGWTLGRTFASPGAETRIDSSVVVERVQAVAKLVSSEVHVRDVVSYESTWMGSTKRSLVIATGRVLVGFDLVPLPAIHIDEEQRRIRIDLPAARVLGVDILELKTYDERRGLWNPFHPADRDTIYQLARKQLEASSRELGVLTHAEQSAARLMQTLFAEEEYTVEVVFPSRRLANTRY